MTNQQMAAMIPHVTGYWRQYALCRRTGYSRIAAAAAVAMHFAFGTTVYFYPKWRRDIIERDLSVCPCAVAIFFLNATLDLQQ